MESNDLTEFQMGNLTLLRDYLMTGVKKGTQFSMATFCAEERLVGGTDCGTVGCAVGHGPYAGIPKFSDESWAAYSGRAFGGPVRSSDFSEAEYRYTWLFDYQWEESWNTPGAAALRIDALLRYGSVQAIVDNYDGLDYITRQMVLQASKDHSERRFPKLPLEVQEPEVQE